MVERICPQCQRGNPLENRFCGQCGASLDRDELAPRPSANMMLANTHLPVQLRQVGQALAVSLATLAAEASLAWLRRRIEQINLPATPTTRPTSAAPAPRSEIVPASTTPTSNIVTIFSQRVVEVWDRDGLLRQTIERNVWRREG